MMKQLDVHAALRPHDCVVLKLDFRNAYNTTLRAAILSAVSRLCPALLPIANTLLPVETIHRFYGEEGVRELLSERGCDQGCPLSPAFFGIAIAPALELLLQDLRRDPSDDETLLLDWLAEREIPRIVVLTKIDKLKPMRRQQRIAAVKKGLEAPGARILATSSQSRAGIDELWKAIFQLVNAPIALGHGEAESGA